MSDIPFVTGQFIFTQRAMNMAREWVTNNPALAKKLKAADKAYDADALAAARDYHLTEKVAAYRAARDIWWTALEAIGKEAGK